MTTLKLTGQRPNEKQRQFFLSRARHTAYGGARGGGKSWAMRRKFLLLAIWYPGLSLLLLRRTYPELEENHIKPLKRELPGVAKYTDKRKEFVFLNGSRIKCGYCDKEDDVLQYQGQEYDVIGLEEATHFCESQMQFICTCNRTTRRDFFPRMYYTCNPGGVGHAWVKRLFIDREYQNSERGEDYSFIPASVYDNSVLMRANPQYVHMLENLPAGLRRAHLEGDWDALLGQYFETWRRARHVCEPFSIPKRWKRFCAMDWGYNDPCCVLWFAVAPDGRVYVYDEYYRRKILAHDVAKAVGEISGGDKIAYTVASPDMWQRRGAALKSIGGVSGECIADVFIKRGVPLRPADNARVVGWQRVREYLREAPDGLAYLQVFARCANLIKYLPLMQYDRHDHEDAACGDDHAPEALRYGLMSRPAPSREKACAMGASLPGGGPQPPANPFLAGEKEKTGYLIM
ncbi:MAG: phage terminase large subunit [Clostridiales bacterium]|nr:phage terminase large subunit [Clostridiales bacterium]